MSHSHNDGTGKYIVHSHPHEGLHWHPDIHVSDDYYLAEIQEEQPQRPQQVDITTAALNDLGALSGFYGLWVTVGMLVLGAAFGFALFQGHGAGAVLGLFVAGLWVWQGWENGARQKKALRDNERS